MKWLEASVAAGHERIDELCQRLTELGIEGMSIEDEEDFQRFLAEQGRYWDSVDPALTARFAGISRIKFYVADDEAGRSQLMRVREGLGEPLDVIGVDDSDWVDEWKKYYKVIEVGERLAIVPEWETYDNPEQRVVLRLDPGLTFGTGGHATTQLCLQALEQYAPGRARCLDIGCGSGILTIAACLLGCESAVGCDLDPLCEQSVQRNARLNGLDETRITVEIGDILTDSHLTARLGTGYDVVLANIVADVIIPLSPLVRKLLAPHGVFICSGIIDGREQQVTEALQAARLHVISHTKRDEWHCFVAV